jgi:phosphomethylpyrimidine synthase
MKKEEQLPTDKSISTTPFPNSKKIYVNGQLHDIEVAMREITLSDTKSHGKPVVKNAPVVVYDTSGPYTDPNVTIDVIKGLPRLREKWILERNDVEQLADISSDYGHERLLKSDIDHLRFQHIKKPLRAKAGANVSQMHYAKKRHHNSRDGIHCYS